MKKKIILFLITIFVSIILISCSEDLTFTLTDTREETATVEEKTIEESTTIEETTTEETTTEDTTTEETTIEETTTEETTTEDTTTEETTTEETTTEDTTTEETTTEETTTEETTTEETTTEEQNLITELFISEYGEGSSFNKWIEIFNGTGETVDLSSYSIELYQNGSTTVNQTLNLTGSIDNYDVYIIAHPNADASILAEADLTDSQVINWNGDDVVTLIKDDNIIDIIGNIGTSSYFAKDITLVRKDEVFEPNAIYDENEWNIYSQDTFDYIGSHSNITPDDTILLQQDVDALPNEISLYYDYTLGQGSNGSIYTITSIGGDATTYIDVLADDNTIEVILDTEVDIFGTITVLITLNDDYSDTKVIDIIVKPIDDYNSNIPDGYYDDAEGLSGESLLIALNAILNDTYSYVSYDDARYILDESDMDPNNPDNIILVYTGNSIDSTWDAGATWNREHIWPQSLLFNSMQTSDLHNLKPADPSVNSSRGNKYYDYFTTNDTFEPRDEVKGDVARILFYMMVMYDDLDLVDYVPSEGEMALFTVLLEWHLLDPVDDFERNRNDVIYSYQGNRNPFIDYPEYVEDIWG